MKTNFIKKTREIIKSPYFAAFLFALSVVATLFKLEVYFSLAFAGIISAILIISDDTLDTTLPFLLLSVFVAMCYNSYNTFIKFVPFAPILVFAVIFHFVKYKKPVKVGSTFGGVCAVAIAVTLGGLFNITTEEYFGGSSLYYTAGLGVGMVILYLLMKSRLSPQIDKNEENMLRFAKMMYLMGALAFICVLGVYIREWDVFIQNKTFIEFRSRNNFATFLMLAMPFPCYFSLKNKIHFFTLAMMYAGILLTSSRGGLIFGSIELLICLVYLFAYDKKSRAFYFVVYSILIIAIAVCAPYIFKMYAGRIVQGDLISAEESRSKLLLQSIDDFLSSPLFGVGIGYRGNANIYNPVSGAMNWYHMMIPQIIGSMGLCGVAAYGYQMFTRFRVWIKTKNALTTCLFLSYIGLLLMSQVNPGEFCPIPYTFLAVFIFIFLENQEEKERLK